MRVSMDLWTMGFYSNFGQRSDTSVHKCMVVVGCIHWKFNGYIMSVPNYSDLHSGCIFSADLNIRMIVNGWESFQWANIRSLIDEINQNSNGGFVWIHAFLFNPEIRINIHENMYCKISLYIKWIINKNINMKTKFEIRTTSQFVFF